MQEVQCLSKREAQKSLAESRFHGIDVREGETKSEERRKAEREDEGPGVEINRAFVMFG